MTDFAQARQYIRSCMVAGARPTDSGIDVAVVSELTGLQHGPLHQFIATVQSERQDELTPQRYRRRDIAAPVYLDDLLRLQKLVEAQQAQPEPERTDLQPLGATINGQGRRQPKSPEQRAKIGAAMREAHARRKAGSAA